MRRKPAPKHDDLFAIFPDLPRPRPRTREQQLLRMRALMLATRDRAKWRIAQQRKAVEHVRERLAQYTRRFYGR